MMKKVVLFVLLFVVQHGWTQNTMRFAQLNFAQGVNNPAAIAIDGRIMADMIFRNQWFGFDGGPTTVAFNGQYEINESMATGLVFSYDRIGVDQTTSVSGQYAYRVHFRNNNTLIFGLGLGLDNRVRMLGESTTLQANDPAFSKNYASMYFNGSFGVFYNSPKFYLGIGIPRLFQTTGSGPDPGFQPPRWHQYLTTGFYIEAGENFMFNPHIQIKYVYNAPLQGDIILRNSFYNRFSIVVGYRSENSIIAGFDVRINGNARVGYSFNYDVGKLSRAKGMSNEVYLGLAFPYHSDRYDFGSRRYINGRGNSKMDHRRKSRTKEYNRGRRYGRKTKYR